MQNITAFMKDLDARYRSASGLKERRDYSIFYSQITRSPLVILGFNPGGNPENWDESQLASKAFYENGEHEYVDCNYKIAVAMREYLLSALQLAEVESIRRIPKSNLIFRRSVGQGSLSVSSSQALQESQPFVEEIIARVSPSYILLEGTTTLTSFERAYCINITTEIDGPSIETPNGKHMARIYRADNALVKCLGRTVPLIGIGHPSKYAGRPEWSDVVQRSRRVLEQCHLAS